MSETVQRSLAQTARTVERSEEQMRENRTDSPGNLKELPRLAQRARRRWNKDKKAALEMLLVEAERAGRFATVCKLSWLLYGKCGPKRRQHRAVKRHQTVEQWEEELSAPRHQGSMGAVACSFDDVWAKWTSTTTFEEKEEPDANAHEAERLVRTRSNSLTGEERPTGRQVTRDLRCRCSGNASCAPWGKPSRPSKPLLSSTAAGAQASPSPMENCACCTFSVPSGPRSGSRHGRTASSSFDLWSPQGSEVPRKGPKNKKEKG